MKRLTIFLAFSFIYGGLITPEDGATLNHIHVLFEWEQIPEADHYQIQITEDSDFSNLIVNTDDNTLAYIEKIALDWNSTYYWRTRPIYTSGVSGSWTDSFSFTTGSSLSSTTATFIDESQSQSGVTVFGAFFNYFSAAVDQTGKEIWNSGDNDFVYYSTSDVGDVFGCYLLPGAENNLPGIEISFRGEIIWEEPNDEFLHHDIIRLPNGNYLGIVETSSLGPIPIGGWTASFQGLGFQADGVTVEFPWVGDKLVEWDKDTKDVVWSWNVFDHFNMSDYDQFGGTWIEAYLSLHYDWTHVNAVIFDEDESDIYISTRHLSRITKIDYPSGEVLWNLGHQMTSGDVNMGTDLGFSFQHSLQKLENGNILTFDNGNLAPEFRGTDDPVSRAIEISVDGSDASLVWSYELPADLFGFASGNTQKLENGNVLITTVGGGGRSLEVNPGGSLVWEGLYNLSLPDGAVYRAHRIPGLFPAAYSVMIDNFMESGDDVGVYVPIGSSDISYTLNNEGGYLLVLSCYLSDNEGWFGSQTTELTLEPNATETISFTGNVSAVNGGNPIILTVVPIHHPERSKTISVDGFTSPLAIDEDLIPNSFRLDEPYPNPFNPATIIQYSMHNEQNILLQVFNISGQLVETLVNGTANAGQHSILWSSSQISTGIYFIKMSTDLHCQTRKVLYLR